MCWFTCVSIGASLRLQEKLKIEAAANSDATKSPPTVTKRDITTVDEPACKIAMRAKDRILTKIPAGHPTRKGLYVPFQYAATEQSEKGEETRFNIWIGISEGAGTIEYVEATVSADSDSAERQGSPTVDDVTLHTAKTDTDVYTKYMTAKDANIGTVPQPGTSCIGLAFESLTNDME